MLRMVSTLQMWINLRHKEHPGQPKKFQDEKLEAILHEYSCQTLEQLAQKLQVDESTVYKRLKALEMFRNGGNWVSIRIETVRCEEVKSSCNCICVMFI